MYQSESATQPLAGTFFVLTPQPLHEMPPFSQTECQLLALGCSSGCASGHVYTNAFKFKCAKLCFLLSRRFLQNTERLFQNAKLLNVSQGLKSRLPVLHLTFYYCIVDMLKHVPQPPRTLNHFLPLQFVKLFEHLCVCKCLLLSQLLSTNANTSICPEISCI